MFMRALFNPIYAPLFFFIVCCVWLIIKAIGYIPNDVENEEEEEEDEEEFSTWELIKLFFE